ALVLAYITASSFQDKTLPTKRRFFLIFLGALSHLVLDMTMYPWEELGIQLFYPVPIRFSFHIFWPDYIFYPIFGIIALGISLLFYQLSRNRKSQASSH
ncbi:MAG: metal-dependent hydrolase, partial [Candidatus Thorarchaeota archaeon]